MAHYARTPLDTGATMVSTGWSLHSFRCVQVNLQLSLSAAKNAYKFKT